MSITPFVHFLDMAVYSLAFYPNPKLIPLASLFTLNMFKQWYKASRKISRCPIITEIRCLDVDDVDRLEVVEESGPVENVE